MKRLLEILTFLYAASAFFIAYTSVRPAICQQPPIDHSNYKIVIWTQPGCWACIKYKKNEQPVLEKLGYKVEVREAPESETAPTITLYYGDTVLHSEVYWTAEKIEKFVENRSKLK